MNIVPPSDVQQKLQASLPLLPGHNFNLEKHDLLNHRKSHAFDYCNEVSIFKKEAPGIGGNYLKGQKEDLVHTSVEIYPNFDGKAERVPAWVAFDRKVLRFYAYFQEAVHEKREEQYRVRKVNIYFYLEDDTIHVSEPRSANSGLPQGTLIRRHRVPKPEAVNGQHYIISDFNVGVEVTFYSITFKIVGCDQFTREFLTTNNIIPPVNSFTPQDPYTTYREELLSRMKPTRSYIPKTSLKKFLENDRRVLRFFCIWDDTNSVFGDVRQMVIHYYLSDDTIEIRECIPANSGRETNTLFLRRCKLPKRPSTISVHGSDGAGRGGGAAGGGGGGEDDFNPLDFYGETDLLIGSVLHLYGRPFVICDCDEFTKNYYRETYSLDLFDPVKFDLNPDENPKNLENANNYNFIDQEDLKFFQKQQEATSPSILVPNILIHTKDNKDVENLNNNLKFDFRRVLKYDGISLRFEAKLMSKSKIDRERRFIINLYPADDTISVFEPRQRNSGIIGGKFMEKGRNLKPDNKSYYHTFDFKIGEIITLHGHQFHLTDADEFAKKFMKEHPEMFNS
ncbi:EF-hand domain-containing member C2 [Lobulomyces angularis]|nr:EF-hand domain-containing member C2 [Lobulomyces angularis]